MKLQHFAAALLLAAAALTAHQITGFAQQRQANSRFQSVDANGDGIIQRSEWRGSPRSFDVHDWNADGVLSGNEIQPGMVRPQPEFDDYTGDSYAFSDWSQQRFASLDRNRDGRVARTEWPYGVEEFFRADRDRDGSLSQSEFVGSDFDDDRGDRFDYLDADNNGRIERGEWHASAQAFDWLDRDNNNVITRQEMGVDTPTAAPAAPADTFARLDTNRDQRVSAEEWAWSRRSFDQRDSNRDGVLTRAELGASSAGAFGASGASGASGSSPRVASVSVRATQQWTDTGVVVQSGDRVSFTASGQVQLSGDGNDIADPKGARSGRVAPEGPLPRAAAGALIARIGETAPVLIGDRTDGIRAPASGRLYLGVNDDYHQDNKGNFNVEVVVTR